MASNCYSCIMDRGKFEADLCLRSEEDKILALEELLDYMVLHKRGVPALVGTEREFIMKRRSANPDPYMELKQESNAVALDLLPIARRFYQESGDKLQALMRIAAAANSMEFGVKGHDFDNKTFTSVFMKTLEEPLHADLEEVSNRLDRFSSIYYLTDNAGEAVFDLMVADILHSWGKRVVMGPKAAPILNDVTATELAAMAPVEIVPTGDVVGLSLERLDPRALALLQNPEWLILAKGMGNYETMTEFDDQFRGRLIYIMRAKCQPVADNLGVPRGSLVIKAI